MFALIIQTILLLAVAFILGCILGCLLHRMFGAEKRAEPAPAKTVAAPRETVAPVPAAPVQPVEKAPVVPAPPAPLVSPPVEAKSPTKPKTKPQPKAKAPAKPKAAAPKIAPATGAPDNLKLIRGIGPQNEARLNEMGVLQFAQIAKWSKKDQREMGEAMSFPGRIEREEWVPQARALAKGNQTDFSKRVSSGSVSTSVGAMADGSLGKKPENLLDAPREGKGDNLTLIDGVGNAIERKMFKLGIYHFDQIVAMTPSELKWLGAAVGFPGRAERENWQGEARTLDSGGTTEHAKRVERGQIKTSRKS